MTPIDLFIFAIEAAFALLILVIVGLSLLWASVLLVHRLGRWMAGRRRHDRLPW